MKENMMLLIRFLCLLASNFGYYNLLRKKTKLDISFLPIVTIGIQFSILFIAGILNILLPAAAAMLTVGMILFVLDLVHKKIGEYSSFVSIPYAYLGVSLIILFFLLRKGMFYEFDDFSHWATVVQQMMAHNAYPTHTNPRILFPTYPLGSATYIYYCCLLAGPGENAQMMAQAFMIICTILPLFSCIHKYKVYTFFFILFFTNFLLVYGTPIDSLLVDTLLPLFGMGTFLVTWNLCDSNRHAEETQGKSDMWVAGPLLIMTMMIKNSGIFFAIPSMILIARIALKDQNHKIQSGLAFFSPIAAMILWYRHCVYVFPDALQGKHAVSYQHYAREFEEKTAKDIADIGYGILEFLLHHPTVWYLAFLMLAIMAVTFLFHRSQTLKVLKFSGLLTCMYVLYMLGLFGMYVFSMPQIEAEILNEISRYAGTMDLAAFYLIAAYILGLLNALEFNRKSMVPLMAAFSALILLWGGLDHWRIVSTDPELETRMILEERIKQYNVPLGSSCIICSTKTSGMGYLVNLTRYILWSDQVYLADEFNEKNVDNIKYFQYILMADFDNEMINKWISENYPEQYGNGMIVIK